VGVCHFGSFHAAMDSAQHIVKLKPIAVELVDATMIALASEIAMFRPTLDAVVRGEPQALLLVEFAEDDAENVRRLKQLGEVMGDLGFGFDGAGAKWGGVVEVLDPSLQAAITDLRTSGLNIMMSMKDEAKPISFVEDCAVPLEHLADYTEKLTRVLCVQRRLACSAGERPAGARVRSPVVWIAGWRETKTLKPIDNVSLGETTSHRAVTTVNAKVASKVSSPEGRACNRRAKAAWGSRNLTDAAPSLRRGGSDSTVARICRATGEALLVPA